MKKDNTIYKLEFSGWRPSVSRLLEGAGLADLLAGKERVVIKPNLVEAFKPPITTPPELVGEIIDYLKAGMPDLEIIVAEGSGALNYDTWHTFEALGYQDLARDRGVALVDLNTEPLLHFTNSSCRRWPEMFLPEILFDSFLISVPVLKAHSLAGVTLTMKNMMGVAPPKHYQKGGHWKKASFHDDLQAAVLDLNQYRTPDFTILDATVGMRQAHLWGPTCDPPVNTLAACRDPVAIDAYGAGLLNRDWRNIGHIAKAHGLLGIADPLEVMDL